MDMKAKLGAGAAAVLILVGLAAHLGCRREIVEEPYRPSDAHENYLHSLRLARLADTALGRDWISASRESLRAPVEVTPPFEEVFYADPKEAFAVAYRFPVKRGQRVELEALWSGPKPPRLFMDLFRDPETEGQEWLQVASADIQTNRLAFEPRREGRYVVRLQPELLRGGSCRVTIVVGASLGFPVKGQDTRSFGGGFGAPRGGGRVHRGVDIFAKRHTEVLAPAKARVRFVGENDLGGNVVWLYDTERSLHYYFAHLQTQNVEAGAEVEPGQVIGTVGNSGNASRTPPHLHFGIYAANEGGVDPHYFIAPTQMDIIPLTAGMDYLGKWVRSREPQLSLRESAHRRAEEKLRLEVHSPMQILGASGGMFRVLLADGSSGYVSADSVEPVEGGAGHPETDDSAKSKTSR